MFIHLNKRGQSTLEYAVIIAVIVAALIAMQVYVRRGLQGRLKQASDDIGGQFSASSTTTNYSTSLTAVSTEDKPAGEDTKTVTGTNQTQTRTGSETSGDFASENWYSPINP